MTSERRAADLFAHYREDIYRRTDRLFAGLMGLQWIAGIVFAVWVSPLAWSGATSRTHLHVWAAIVLGGIISLFPAVLALVRPGLPSTRYIIATAQMLMGALLIHLTGGRIETHFHVFGSLAFLAFYRDWRVLVPATIVVALDHFLRGVFWPQSVYGVLVASQWRWVEHAAWVFFEDIFLVVSCLRSEAEMRQRAERTAALEQEVRIRLQAERGASLTAAVGLALTRGTESQVMFQECAEALVEHLDGGFAGIWTVDEPEEWLEPLAAAGANRPSGGTGPRTRVGDGTIGHIARDRAARVARGSDVEGGADSRDWTGCQELAAFAGYPLLLHGKLIGVLAVFAHQEFSPPALDAMAAVADGVALAVDRTRAAREVARYTRDLEQAHDLQRQNAEQLTTLVDQLRVTQRQAEAATRAKSDFLASMSHELRTPLNAIILYSELLQEEAADRAQTGSIPDLQRIQGSGKHLLELINGILDLSKIEAGKMTLSLEEIDVKSMVADVLDTLGPIVRQKNNTLEVRCSPDLDVMFADLMKTRQILLNLLSNAGKFTRNGTITLEVRPGTIDGTPAVEFTVTDTGMGMTAEQTARIFDPFTQADVTTTRKYGGTGLGLAIVSRFCVLMGGRVSVQSEPGRGSRFTVVLPAVVLEATGEPTAAA
jgi:two-component system, sensor histidine kinase and response regulator